MRFASEGGRNKTKSGMDNGPLPMGLTYMNNTHYFFDQKNQMKPIGTSY